MPDSEEQIKKDIKAYIDKGGGVYRDWYVGISAHPPARLKAHGVAGVDEKKGSWIYSEAYSSDAARNVEAYFIDTLGTDGGPGGGDEDADSVYAYKKTTDTNP